MTGWRRLISWLLGKRRAATDRIATALAAFRDPAVDVLPALRRLVAALRPEGLDADPAAGYTAMLEQLEADAELRRLFREQVIAFLASRRLVTFFTDSGMLPGTGFFSEWWRILGHRLLPEVPDERRLKDCLHVIFDRSDDWQWLEQVPPTHAQRLWHLLADHDAQGTVDWQTIQQQMLDAVLLLAHRVSGLGVDGELLRAAADFDANTPSFMALSAEALDFVSQFRTALATQMPLTDDGSHLQVIVAQCEDALGRIRRRALSTGTSLHLSYLLTRSEQNLARIRELTVILAASHASETDDSADTAINAWAAFARAAFLAENRRNSLRHYLSELSRLLAVRVTENAARSGEHYICESSADYRHMWLSAGGAGVLIGLMALLKIKAAALHAPPLIEAFLFSMIYGGGFVLIYLLGMTVATKQPAMTAQTLAGMLGDLRATRNAELERMVDVAAAVSRSQLAAIAGNVLVALPVAIAVGVGLGYWHGEPAVPLGKAAHLLDDLDPLSWAIPHAAIAGFYLFLSGLITGYFDNRASYDDVGPRIGRLRWLRRLVGSNGAQRIGRYISERMGGIMGNFLFGCMLGSTGILGSLVGLPLDIRHIAFASANLGYALTGFDFALPIQAALWALLGIAAIGFTNLAVSFALALRTALGARRVQFNHWGTLVSAIWRRFRSNPRDFLLPPRNASGG
ncbi:MAG: hypothetical protein E6Q64_06235 [Ottowia sp.]|nr:MAG: hypothetical protein E6Q64_06235 [Ottowia sp.]